MKEIEEIATIDYIKPPDNRPRRPGYRWVRYATIHDVIFDLGQHYKVKGDLKEYPWRGIKRSSFANAFRLANLYTGLRYAEGYVMPPTSGIPFLHGWCLTRDNLVIDPTLPNAVHYRGVLFCLDTVRRLRILTGQDGVLKAVWPLIRQYQAA